MYSQNSLIRALSNIVNGLYSNQNQIAENENTSSDRLNNLTQANELYLLSIHSTKRRSRRRKHIRKQEDIIVLNKESNCENLINKPLSLESVSFSGGGYNCMYHVGAVKYIFENPDLFKGTKYLGASGGAGIVALVLCYELDPERFEVLEKIINFVSDIREKYLRLNQQVEEYSKLLFGFITEDRFNQFIKNSDRCVISVTNVTYLIPINQLKSNFSSYSQFMDTLKASACIPVLLDNKIRQISNSGMYLDGGLSNNNPILNSDTLKISCLRYSLMNADLYPHGTFDMKYCFTAPPTSYVQDIYNQGYADIDNHLKSKLIELQQIKNEEEINDCIEEIINDF